MDSLTDDEKRLAHHSFVYDEKKVDTAVFRKEAQDRAFDDRSPENTVIHFHAYEENGKLCPGARHEQYRIGEGLIKEDS